LSSLFYTKVVIYYMMFIYHVTFEDMEECERCKDLTDKDNIYYDPNVGMFLCGRCFINIQLA